MPKNVEKKHFFSKKNDDLKVCARARIFRQHTFKKRRNEARPGGRGHRFLAIWMWKQMTKNTEKNGKKVQKLPKQRVVVVCTFLIKRAFFHDRAIIAKFLPQGWKNTILSRKYKEGPRGHRAVFAFFVFFAILLESVPRRVWIRALQKHEKADPQTPGFQAHLA